MQCQVVVWNATVHPLYSTKVIMGEHILLLRVHLHEGSISTRLYKDQSTEEKDHILIAVMQIESLLQ